MLTLLLLAGVVSTGVTAVVLSLRAARARTLATTMSDTWIAEHLETDGKTGYSDVR